MCEYTRESKREAIGMQVAAVCCPRSRVIPLSLSLSLSFSVTEALPCPLVSRMVRGGCIVLSLSLPLSWHSSFHHFLNKICMQVKMFRDVSLRGGSSDLRAAADFYGISAVFVGFYLTRLVNID